MGLLDVLAPFEEVIFVKTDSSLQREIEELEKVRNDRNKDQVDFDIKLLRLGLQGEGQIEFELKNANLGMYVLHDVTIEFEDQKAQIDWVIITKAYTYLVECKNLIGNIYINNTGEFRREYSFNGRICKEAIYSPYTQAVRHKALYEKLWKSQNTSLLDRALKKDAVIDRIKPLVVLANAKGFLNQKYAPWEIKQSTVRVDNLVRYLERDIASADKRTYINKKEMETQAQDWLKKNVERTAQMAEKYKNAPPEECLPAAALKLSLEKFRTEKSRAMRVPTYYIFTNDELKQILEENPATIEELKQILPAVKVRLHGEEILRIIHAPA